jgi:hypothetical protein
MSPLINRITSSFGFNSKKLISQVASAFSFTGGTPLTPGNGYRYHIFTAPGPFTVTGSKLIDYVVVGGGAPGGNPFSSSGGGGGAGGYRELIGTPITNGSYTVTVAGQNTAGTSSISGPGLSVTSGGGGGAAFSGGVAGASGGGSPGDAVVAGAGNTPPVSPPQGNPGGTAVGTSGYGGAGGGGAGGAGANRTSVTPLPLRRFGTSGGIGRAAFSGDTGIPASYGTPGPTAGRWFAGGGGGGASGPSTGFGAGGTGGGGNGGPAFSASAPLNSGSSAGANTGGGGGGVGNGPGGTGSAGAGGSGIVIIRYLL